MKNIVGENIRKLRIKEGLTQEELAFKSGLSQGYINQLESGKRGFTQKSLGMISSALVVPFNELFKTDYGILEVKEKSINERLKKKKIDSKEFLKLLHKLPAHIAEHYLILLKLEKKMRESKRLKNDLY